MRGSISRPHLLQQFCSFVPTAFQHLKFLGGLLLVTRACTALLPHAVQLCGQPGFFLSPLFQSFRSALLTGGHVVGETLYLLSIGEGVLREGVKRGCYEGIIMTVDVILRGG